MQTVELIALATALATTIQAVALIITIVVMIRTARRQLRAYVNVDGVVLADGSQINAAAKAQKSDDTSGIAGAQELAESQPKNDRSSCPGVHWSVRNSGSTPAYDVLHWGAIDVVEIRLEHALVVPALDPSMPRNHIPPGGSTIKALWFDRQLSEQEIEDIRMHKRGIYIYGRIEYVDAFKKKRITNYRMRYTGLYPPVGTPAFYYCQEGNSAT